MPHPRFPLPRCPLVCHLLAVTGTLPLYSGLFFTSNLSSAPGMVPLPPLSRLFTKVYCSVQTKNLIEGLYHHTNCGAVMGQRSPLQHQTTCSYIVLSLMHTLRQLSNIYFKWYVHPSMCPPSLVTRGIHPHPLLCLCCGFVHLGHVLFYNLIGLQIFFQWIQNTI